MTWTTKRNAWGSACLFQPPMVTGRYYAGIGFVHDTLATTVNNIYCERIWIPSRTALDRIAVERATASPAGALGRLALFNSTEDGALPDKLIVDGGTVALDATGGVEATIAVTVRPGILWIAFVRDTSSGNLRSFLRALDFITFDGVNGAYINNRGPYLVVQADGEGIVRQGFPVRFPRYAASSVGAVNYIEEGPKLMVRVA